MSELTTLYVKLWLLSDFTDPNENSGAISLSSSPSSPSCTSSSSPHIHLSSPFCSPTVSPSSTSHSSVNSLSPVLWPFHKSRPSCSLQHPRRTMSTPTSRPRSKPLLERWQTQKPSDLCCNDWRSLPRKRTPSVSPSSSRRCGPSSSSAHRRERRLLQGKRGRRLSWWI